MNRDISTVHSLRRILESAVQGKGLARSMVEELKGDRSLGSHTARLLLLGYPIETALSTMIEGSSEEVAALGSLIISAPRSSAEVVGKNGAALAGTIERWVKARETGLMEQRVLRFRSLVTSGVLGAVTAMVAAIGPLLGNLGLGPGADATGIPYAAAAMTAISSGMLGFFMSGRSFFVNVLVSMAVFAVVSGVATPLVSVSPGAILGVK